MGGGLRPYLNARFLSAPLTGVQRYAREIQRLVPELQAIAPSSPRHGILGHLWEQTTLWQQTKDGVLWSPCNSGPVFHPRHAVTIHDLAPFDFPEGFTARYRQLYRFLIPQLVKRAQVIFVPSQFSAERLLAIVGSPKKIVLTPNAPAPHLKPATPQAVQELKKVLKLTGEYLLCVGSQDPRKNLALVGAVARRMEAEPNLHFLIAGGGDSAIYASSKVSQRPNVRRLGYVDETTLATLMTGALALLAPSLYEGFGLPIVEAMACGTPVIASAIPPFREVGGNAIVTCPPKDADAWVDVIRDILRHTSRRTELGQRGRERSRQFSWEMTAKTVASTLARI